MFIRPSLSSSLGLSRIVFILCVSVFVFSNVGQAAPSSGTGAIAAIAALIPNDPSNKETPNLYVGDLEVVEAMEMYSHSKEVPGTGGQYLDKDGTKYVIAHWICDMIINRPALSQCTSNVSAPTNTLAEKTILRPALEMTRSLSTTKIIPGSTLYVTITVKAYRDSKVAAVFDFIPEGWSVDEPSANIEFFSHMQAGETRTSVYSVTVPMSVKPGSYSFSGRTRSDVQGIGRVLGDARVEVLSKKSAILFGAVAGTDGMIDDTEMLVAIQRWQEKKIFPRVGRTLSDEELAELLSLWGSEVYLDPKLLLTLRGAQANLSFVPASQNAIEIQREIAIYSLKGQLIQAINVTQQRDLAWHLEAISSQFPNGVYLQILTTKGPTGQITQREVKKFVVLN